MTFLIICIKGFTNSKRQKDGQSVRIQGAKRNARVFVNVRELHVDRR